MGDVSGTVTYEGEPVTNGIIFFVPQNGPQASSELDEQGGYTLLTAGHSDGVAVGKQEVYFAAKAEPVEFSAADELAGRLPSIPAGKINLPAQYLKLQSSGLTAEVIAGSNTIDWKLPQ